MLRAVAARLRLPENEPERRAALVAAEQEQCPLVTGDRRLREAARLEGVEVHGTLWLGRRLVEEGCIAVDELEHAYGRMKLARRRLPWGKVEEQLRDLRGA